MSGTRWRSLLVAAGAGLTAGAAAGALLLWMGFGLRIDVWLLVGLVTALMLWFFRDVLESGQEPPVTEPHEPPVSPWSLDVDRRTRTLEAQLRGAQRGTGTTVTTVRDTIEKIVRHDDRPVPPATARYLASTPRPLSRAQLRTILRELTQR